MLSAHTCGSRPYEIASWSRALLALVDQSSAQPPDERMEPEHGLYDHVGAPPSVRRFAGCAKARGKDRFDVRSSNRSVIDSGHNNTGLHDSEELPARTKRSRPPRTTVFLKPKTGRRPRSAAATRPWFRGDAHRAASAIDRQSAHHRQENRYEAPEPDCCEGRRHQPGDATSGCWQGGRQRQFRPREGLGSSCR